MRLSSSSDLSYITATSFSFSLLRSLVSSFGWGIGVFVSMPFFFLKGNLTFVSNLEDGLGGEVGLGGSDACGKGVSSSSSTSPSSGEEVAILLYGLPFSGVRDAVRFGGVRTISSART